MEWRGASAGLRTARRVFGTSDLAVIGAAGSRRSLALSALDMLLGSGPLFPRRIGSRFCTSCVRAAKYQNVVSTKLAAQVLEALNELPGL